MDEKYSEAMLKRLRNLKMFRDKTDEDIIKYLDSRPARAKAEQPPRLENTYDSEIEDYEIKFRKKLKIFRDEFKIDMNDANDVESLRQLARSVLQLEVIDQKIHEFYQSKSTNTKALKDMGDYQRSLQMSVADLQRTLGIARQIRKEDIQHTLPQMVKDLKIKSRDIWDRKVLKIQCPKDKITLANLWLNFPKLKNEISMELECWKCHEKILYTL